MLVDHEALVRGHTEAGETCEMSGVPVPVSVIHDILDDAFLVGLFTKGMEVQKVHRFGRRIPVAVRDALRVRGPRHLHRRRLQPQRLPRDRPQTALRQRRTHRLRQPPALLCLKHHRHKTATDRLHEPDPHTGPDPPDTS